MYTLLVLLIRITLQVHTAVVGKGYIIKSSQLTLERDTYPHSHRWHAVEIHYILHVYTADGVDGYMLHVHNAGGGKAYALHVYNAGLVMYMLCSLLHVYTPVVENYKLCKSILLLEEKGYTK
jgi:hypothetical protein